MPIIKGAYVPVKAECLVKRNFRGSFNKAIKVTKVGK